MNKRIMAIFVCAAIFSVSATLQGAQGVPVNLVVNRNFEDGQVGSLGGTVVSGENPGIDIHVVEGTSSTFGEGNRSLRYARQSDGGNNVETVFWSTGIDGFQNINTGNARISFDIMFESISGVSGKDPHNMPIKSMLGDGIRIDGGPWRFMYFIIGFAYGDSMGIAFHTPAGVGWISPDAVWKIEEGTWYRIELGLHGLDRGGKNTKGIPESFSASVSTPEKRILEIKNQPMPLSWQAYYDAREERNQAIYDSLGVKRMFVNSSRFGPAGASYTFYIDNIIVGHHEDKQ